MYRDNLFLNMCSYSVFEIVKAVILASVFTVKFGSGFAKENESYILRLPGCDIPDAPLFPEEILYEWNKTFKSSCPKLEPMGIINEDYILKLTPMAKSKYKDCCYKEVYRPQNLANDSYILSSCHQFKDSVDTSTMEYFILICTRTEDHVQKLEFHYNLLAADVQTKQKVKFWKNKDDIPFNIMIVIVDSVSRTQALRALPKTVDFVQNELNFLEFKGYHCVGEPSSTNYIPMSLGISFPNLELKRGTMKGKYDNEPFVHKNFSDSNYITMHIEDMPDYNVFSFNGRTGFRTKPFDFYPRPYVLAQQRMAPRYGHDALSCIDGKNVFDFLLDYTRELYSKFPNVPKYTTTYVTWPSHDSLPGTKLLDNSLLNYFKKLKEENVLNDTIIFFMSDHGFRFAVKWAETKYGLLERNLPLFMTYFPETFSQKFGPELIQHLKDNSLKLTSHFDLFKTLVHLHKLIAPKSINNNYGYNMKYGISLLEEILIDRTCVDANIQDRFCSCNFPLFRDSFDYKSYKKDLTG